MSDEGEVQRMTVAEIRLLRAIAQWRRAERVDFFLWSGAGGVKHGYLSWDGPMPGEWRGSVTFSRDEPGRIGVTRDYRRQSYQWHEVASVGEAVDLLVALGYLPARFSSAYSAGWIAGREDMDHPVPAGPAFAAIVPVRREW